MDTNLPYSLFLVSLLVLLVNLVVLLLLCWTVKKMKDRNLTKIQLLSGEPPRQLTITTKSDDAKQILDHLLDRAFLQEKARPESGEGGTEQFGPDLEEEDGSHAPHAPSTSQYPPDNLHPQESDTSQQASTSFQVESNRV